MTTYTLDEALALVATADSYTYPTIERVGDSDRYTVTNGVIIELSSLDITVFWTYENGPELPKSLIDYSRVHESYETYENAEHVRYNLPAAVEVIEAGKPVTFMWAVVEAYPEEDAGVQCESCGWCEACNADMTVGWMMLAADGAMTRNR